MADLLQLEMAAYKAALQLSWAEESLEKDVRRALDYAHEHLFDDDLTVARLRSQCGLTNNNVSFRFKTVIGSGIRDYIEAMRIEFAKRLLGLGDRSVTEIGMAVGFRTSETFARSFRRLVGVSPTEFRRQRPEV